jgi:hypothetical protein
MNGSGASRRGYRFFKVIGYRTKLSSARNALGYAAFRSDGARQDGSLIFDDRTDSADVKSFMRDLDNDVTRHPKAPKAFHALFSLPTDVHERAGINWPDVVREVMREFEREQGRRLRWIAVEHPDPKHRHVHLIISGASKDMAGRDRRLFLRKPEVERIKELVAQSLENRGLQPEHLRPRDRPVQRQPQTRGPQMAQALGLTLEWLQQSIEAHRKRKQQELERARQEADRSARRDRGR